MSKVSTRIITFPIVILWLSFAATNATSASAHQTLSRRAVGHHADHGRSVRGYAGPVYSLIEDCDLPSNVRSDDERISNYASTGVPLGSGFAGSRFSRGAPNHDSYDGDRFWNGDNCFPTEPGGCN